MTQALDLVPLEKALASLLLAIKRTEQERSDDDMLRDSVIQRFEYTYKYASASQRFRDIIQQEYEVVYRPEQEPPKS